MGATAGILTTMAAVTLLNPAAALAESWELQPAERGTPGSADIEAGRLDHAIRLLTQAVESGQSDEDPALLENLCVAHAMKLEYEQAMRYCNIAVGHPASGASALNNRGVLRAAMGDGRGAVRDLKRASCMQRCSRRAACGDDSLQALVRRNLLRALRRSGSSMHDVVIFHPGV